MRALTTELADWLTSGIAQRALEYAMTLPLTEERTLATLKELQKSYSEEQAAALLDQARLRLAARAKFGSAAGRMLFTDEALQQASGMDIAAFRARRYLEAGPVLDLGCGIGGDALALSRVVPRLLAIDMDPVRVILCRYNLTVAGGDAPAAVIVSDWTNISFPAGFSAAFADPARRNEARRIYSLHHMIPPIASIDTARRHVPQMGVKVMPGVADEELPPDCETEWISERGICKEGVLWFGNLKRGPRRSASLVSGAEVARITSDDPAQALETTPPRAYLYEPDAAVIRATLVSAAALPLGASQLDPQIAYLTGDTAALTPFVRGWPVLAHAPFNLKALNRMLRDLNAAVVAVKKRGSPIEPELFRKRLKSNPAGRPVTVFVTRHRDQPYTVICGEELKR